MSPSLNPVDILREVDPMIWRACAGASVKIPSLYSRVYYFPEGHVEHCCRSSDFSFNPFPVPCIISSIELLADPITDEVFAHLQLQPVSPEQFMPSYHSRFGRYESEEEKEKVTTFAKVLTPSDANNGGGFSVPRYCADSVFPPLDFQADPPVQKLCITDVNGVSWEFRHIYRGTPRRHLLTTGWSKYVNGKKLIAGDSVVFMRKWPDELFIGIRRAPISSSNNGTSFYGGDEYSGYYQSSGGAAKEDDGVVKKFRRIGKGKLTAEAVSEAIDRATKRQKFEVVYYPTAGWSEFVVRAEDVEAAMEISWIPGIRVKMAMETEDSSRITWFQGTVASTYRESGPWRESFWKQLEITWDDPEILQNMKWVNPWQVEVISGHAAFPPNFPNTGGFMNGKRDILYSYKGLSIEPVASDPSPYLYTAFPAGMQGARHVDFGSFNPTGFIGETPPKLHTNNFFTLLPELEKASTEMNIDSPSSENLSPNSNTSNQSCGNDVIANQGPVSVRANTFQLFGKIINVQELSKTGLAKSGLYEEDGSTEVVKETLLSL